MLWKMGFSAAKILPCPPYMPLGTIAIREGFGPLELSKGFSTVCAEGALRPFGIFGKKEMQMKWTLQAAKDEPME